MPLPLVPGCVIRCRPIGMLAMTDEAGEDTKVIAVPVDQVFPAYSKVKGVDELQPLMLERIAHFFEHYKDLEKGKWVKIEGEEGDRRRGAALQEGPGEGASEVLMVASRIPAMMVAMPTAWNAPKDSPRKTMASSVANTGSR